MKSAESQKTREGVGCYLSSSSRGFTLVEIMMGVLIMTIALLIMSTVFTTISKSILVNKTKTIAVNLAQEKIESLKNLSYYRLLVTTASTVDHNFEGDRMEYDIGTTQSYYPEETLVVGDLTFKRRVFVCFAKQVGDDFQDTNWTDNDTGIKKITVYVVWKEGDEWKKVELRNLKNNPDRAQLEFSFTGVVRETGGGVIRGAKIETVENPSYFGNMDNSGVYSFKVQPGTYTLRATATGYFVEYSTSFLVRADQTGSYTKDFYMTKMATGTVSGYAFLRNHLVITQVVSSTDSNDNNGWEWVELYNPTTYNILIASRSTPGGAFKIFFVTVTYICNSNHNPEDEPGGHGGSERARYLLGIQPDITLNFRSTSTHWTINTPTISIPSQSFFLIANVSTITSLSGYNLYRVADAYYTETDGDLMNAIPFNAGGIRVTGAQGYSYNGRTDWHDGLCWFGGGNPWKACEDFAGGANPGWGNVAFRTVPVGFESSVPQRTSLPFAANCYDSNNSQPSSSGGNWSANTISGALALTTNTLLNVDSSLPPGSGISVAGAVVSINDGLSSVAYVQSFGSYSVINVATGTWIVTITSGSYTRNISSVTITPNLSTSVPNNSTSPVWESTGNTIVAITSTTIYGYVSGIVTLLGQPINNVTISAPGADSVQTNSQGRYSLNVIPSGSNFDVTATKGGYSTEMVSNIGVSVGMDVSTVNFTLVSAGSITGFISTNGVPSGKLPGIPIVAYDLTTTTIKGSAISDTNGRFAILNIDTGTYNVAPQLETGETCTPDLVRVAVTAIATGTWIATFTVTNAFGEFVGVVGMGSSTAPITTGVLIVATTAPITTTDPPTIDAGVRAGTQIYYAISSNASGSYSLPLRGNASYYLYGWYTRSLTVDSSSTTKKQMTAAFPYHYLGAGQTLTKDIVW